MNIGVLEPMLSQANLSLGKLDGIGAVVPNPDLFVRMYGRKEAVLSSQIEGTQASLSDVLEEEARIPRRAGERPADVAEVLNYVRALNNGLRGLSSLPLSLRLLRNMHAVLLTGVRGRDKTPGEFRRTQNWIGPEGCTLANAEFVPPAPHDMHEALANLELYLRAQDALPVLVRAGVAHAQFETIHPFLDGNGRLGRLLITFMLSERRVLSRPLLYLSFYFKKHKREYYDWLMRVREEGEWEGWLRFFLNGVATVSDEAATTARRVLDLQQRDRDLVRDRLAKKANALHLLEKLYLTPTVTVRLAAGLIDVSIPTANTLLADLAELGVLREITGRDRDRVFRHVEYLRVLTPGTPSE